VPQDKQKQTQIPFGDDKLEAKANAGISPLRVTIKPSRFGRDDKR
jgi:hypothetical protein